jgi:hypothetical protein
MEKYFIPVNPEAEFRILYNFNFDLSVNVNGRNAFSVHIRLYVDMSLSIKSDTGIFISAD